MICTRCGFSNPDGTRYCTSCGNEMTDRQGGPRFTEGYIDNQISPQKSIGFGIVFSALIVGLGHLYAEKIGKGIALSIIFVVLMIITMTFYMEWMYYGYPSGALFALIFGIPALLLWIWTLYDARDTIKEYNQHLRTRGTPPW